MQKNFQKEEISRKEELSHSWYKQQQQQQQK